VIFSLNGPICTVLLKGLKIAFVAVFEICNQISFALILILAPGARKATSKCSRAANCLVRGRVRLADFGFIWEMFIHFSSKRPLLHKKTPHTVELHPSGREKIQFHQAAAIICWSVSSEWITQIIGKKTS